jgi:hypothetical protein
VFSMTQFKMELVMINYYAHSGNTVSEAEIHQCVVAQSKVALTNDATAQVRNGKFRRRLRSEIERFIGNVLLAMQLPSSR